MSSIKISNLNSILSVTSEDFFPMVNSASLTTYKTTFQSILDLVADSGSAPTSSYSYTSSFLLYSGIPNGTASYAISSSYSNTSSYAISSSHAVTSSYTLGSSTATNAESASFASGSHVTATTSSYARSASYAITSSFSTGNPYGLGAQYQYAYWNSTNELTASSAFTVGIGTNSGRFQMTRPLTFHGASSLNNDHVIMYSGTPSTYNEHYSLGLQGGNTYLRTGKNFALYYSGSYTAGSALSGKESTWYADSISNLGISGWTVFGVRQRLLGVGHFTASSEVRAQLHVHVGSDYTAISNYNPTEAGTAINDTDLFLVTSGSTETDAFYRRFAVKYNGFEYSGSIFANEPTSSTAGAISGYLPIVVNGVSYKLPIYAI